MYPVRRALLAAALCLCVACGESGTREAQPVEVTFSALRPGGASFEVPVIQTANGDHRLVGRAFQSPHLFVLENGEQPVKGVFKNRDPQLPLVVELNFGLTLVSRQEIPPGVCCIVAPGANCATATETCEELEPLPMRHEVRFEVFTPLSPSGTAFSATIGDEKATNITACALGSDVCTTPATFFLEEAEGRVSGVFTKLAGQDPATVFRVELYVDGHLKDSGSGTQNVVVKHEL